MLGTRGLAFWSGFLWIRYSAGGDGVVLLGILGLSRALRWVGFLYTYPGCRWLSSVVFHPGSIHRVMMVLFSRLASFGCDMFGSASQFSGAVMVISYTPGFYSGFSETVVWFRDTFLSLFRAR